MKTGRAFVWLVLGLSVLAGTASATTHTVNVGNFSFSPADITVAPGDSVMWVRVAGTHTVTSGASCTFDGLYFDTAINSSNPTYTWIVPTGVAFVPYFCRPHCAMGMVGSITIQSGQIANLQITLDGGQEVPPVSTTATGTGTATLDTVTNLLSWNITFSGLSSAQTAAHFHGAAAPCSNAGVQVGLPNGSPVVGSAQLTPTQAANVLAGKWYVNIHTSNFPGGEIRGWVMPAAVLDPIPATIPLGDLRARLRPVASGMTAPNWGASVPVDANRFIVGDQNGILWAVDLSAGTKSVYFDLSARLVPLGVNGPGTFDERGLLSFAFHPDYAQNGLLFTFTSEPVSGPADFTTLDPNIPANCQSVIAEWQVPNPADPNSLPDVNSRRELLRVDKPQFNHNGGALVFGPDGMLYVTFGDGGGGDDRDRVLPTPRYGHGCAGNGLNNEVILGKIIRIDPLGNNSANGQYGIPADNPFVGVAGLDENYSLGWRNPWRFSFDFVTGDLIVPDVGQNAIEEINLVAAGGNYGWRAKEGSFYFVFNGDLAGYVTDQPIDVPPGLIDPVAEYDHDEGLAVVGGFVYRGDRYPQLVGKYVFGDFAQTFTNDGRLFYLDGTDIKEFRLLGQPGLGLSLDGFGQDATGELYVMGNTTGTPFGTTGVVLRLASPAGDMNCDGVVDFDDINPLVLALSDQASYEAEFPNCYWLNGDCNADNTVDFTDINAFVDLIGT